MTHRMLLRSVAILAICAAGYTAPTAAGAVQVTAFQQAVAENVSRDSQVAAFYRDRGFAPIWTGGTQEELERRTALLEALSSARHHGLPADRYKPETLL